MAPKTPAKRTGVAKAAPAARRRIEAVPADHIPDELRGFYDEPELSTRGGAADEVSLDFTTPKATEQPQVPMEKLFSIDGRQFFIPVEFGPGMGFVYLDGVTEGRDVALGRVLRKALGETAWRELVNYAPHISGPQMQYLLDKVMKKIMGTIEENGEGNG